METLSPSQVPQPTCLSQVRRGPSLLDYWRIAVHWCHLATQVLHHYNARVFADSVTLWPMPCTLHWGEVKPGLPHHLLRHLLQHPWCNLHLDTSLIFQSVARILHRVDCKKDDCDGESLLTNGEPPENILMVTSTQVRFYKKTNGRSSTLNSGWSSPGEPFFFQLRESVVVSEVNRQAVCGCPQTARICLAKYANIYIWPNMQIFANASITETEGTSPLTHLGGVQPWVFPCMDKKKPASGWNGLTWITWINMDNMDKHG